MKSRIFHRKIGVMLVLAWLLIAGALMLAVRGTAVAHQLVIYPIEDTYVEQSNPDVNYGSSEILKVNYYTNNYKYAFFKFNLSAIPPDLPVSRAWLKLYFKTSNCDRADVYVYETSNDWSELTLTYNNMPALTEIYHENYGSQICLEGWYQIDVTSYIIQHLGENVTLVFTVAMFNKVHEIYSTEYSDSSYWPRLVIEYNAYTTITQNITITETETVTNTITETVTETAMITTTLTDYVTETQTTTVTQTDTVYTTETAYMTSTVTTTQTITDVITETATTTITQTETAWANQTVTITTTITPTTTVTVYGNETVTMTEYGNSTAPEINYQALTDALMPIVLIVGVIGTLLGLLLQSTSFRRGD